MKHIHFPTLALHGIILALAALTINDYPGTFLLLGVIILVLHAAWAAESERLLGPSHLLGIAIQYIVFVSGWIHIRTGGLSGGGFAMLFYQVALAISILAEILIWLYKTIKA